MDDDSDDNDIAMQARCTHCLLETYALNVIAYSYGESSCHNCGHISRQMTQAEYREALTAARKARR